MTKQRAVKLGPARVTQTELDHENWNRFQDQCVACVAPGGGLEISALREDG